MAQRIKFYRRPKRMPAWAFILGLLLAVSIVAGLPYLIAANDAQRPPQEQALTSLDLPPGTSLAGLEEAEVLAVVDGDTIEVALNGRAYRVRYFGVNTPERGVRCFREATDRNETLIGKRVLLLSDSRTVDSFGRLLRYVFLPDGVSVDATLVAEGYGEAWRDDGRYRDQIITIEEQARTANRGCLWGD